MSQDNPIFTPRHPFQQPASSPPPQGGGGQTVLVVLAIIGAVGLAVCCGMGSLVYFSLQAVNNGPVVAELPARQNAFAEDAARFNRALAQLQDDPCDDAGICEFVRRSAAAGNRGDAIPFSRSMFLEATAKSHHTGGRLPISDRMLLSSWLEDSEPQPDTEDFYRILNIDTDASGDLASVDLLFYSADNQCESYQWFLVREAGDWKVYDWQRMEYGRRMSDEYAGYVKSISPDAEGYDEVIAKLGNAQQLWDEGESETAKNILLACERTPMLPGDLPVAQLRIAYMWLAWSDNEQAIRVLESVQAPDQRWGVWPVLSMAYLHTGDYEKALELVERARQQSPEHPNVYWLLSEIYDGLERTDEAADAALQAFVICPQDITLLNGVVYYERAQDLPVLLKVLLESPSEAGWSRVLNQASYSATWATALVEQLALHDDVPLGAAEIAAGNLAWSQQDYDTAAKHFAAAKEVAEQAFLAELASRDYLYARMEEDRFAEMLAESDDVDATLLQLVRLTYDDEFYGDETKLLEAIEQQPALADNIWATALRGWIYSISDQPEPALAEFVRFADWLKANEGVLDADDEWLASTADYYIADSLLELKRPLDVLARWPEDRERHDQIGALLLRLREQTTIEDFLRSTADNPVDSVRLQRLRLQAELAFRANQPTACDQFHLQADELARQIYGEQQRYQVSGLRWRRAYDMVWAQDSADRSSTIAAVLALQDVEQRDSLAGEVARRARQTHDQPVLEACLQQADANGITDGELLAELQAESGQLSLIQGRFQQAIDALQTSFENTSSDKRWDRNQRRESLLLALLRAKQFDAARAFATAEPAEYEEEIPTVAVVDLAVGDEQALRSHFKASDRDSMLAFGDWLSDSTHRHWLQQYADQAWLDQLLRDVPMSVRSQQAEAEGTLLFAAETSFAEADVQQFLRAAAGKPFQLSAVNLGAADSNSQAWLATAAGGQRLVVHSYLATCPNQGLRIENAVAFMDNVRALTITVLDTQPQAMRRLFAVAAAAAAQTDCIGFWYENEYWLWTQPELASQLQWTSRVPVGPEVARHPVFELQPLQADEPQDYTDIEQWDQRLKASDGPLQVSLTLSCGSAVETVPCVLEAVDVDAYDLAVRPTANSLLFPWIRQGILYNSGVGFVQE